MSAGQDTQVPRQHWRRRDPGGQQSKSRPIPRRRGVQVPITNQERRIAHSTAVLQFPWRFRHRAKWLLLPPQPRESVAVGPGVGKNHLRASALLYTNWGTAIGCSIVKAFSDALSPIGVIASL